MIGLILLALLGIFGLFGFLTLGQLTAEMTQHLVVGLAAGAFGVSIARWLKQKLSGMILFAGIMAAGYSVLYGLFLYEAPWWDILSLTRFAAILYAVLVAGIVAAITGAIAWVALRLMPKRFELYAMVGLAGAAVVGLVLMAIPYLAVPSEVYQQGFDTYAVRQVVGTSMAPTLVEGDWILIRTRENPLFEITVGSVVVFFPDKTALVNPEAMAYVRWGVPTCHRVVHLYEDYVLTRGDNVELPSDFYFGQNEVLGEVCKIYQQPDALTLWVIGHIKTEM